jgi:hypothetical protein
MCRNTGLRRPAARILGIAKEMVSLLAIHDADARADESRMCQPAE